jgi:hypothetical protein
MKYWCARIVALLCVVSCAALAAVEVSTVRAVRTSDQNGDGRPDIWRHYDNRGQVTRIDIDTNFDGRPDVEEYYERGALVRRESDRHFNGQADLVEEFDVQTHHPTRSVVDIDDDGTADLLVLFQDGQATFSKRNSSTRRSAAAALHSLVDRRTPGGDTLAKLLDPFRSDSALRARPAVSTDESCVGLSTSGGLPSPRITASIRLSPSARLVARDVQPRALILLSSRSPRAPPAC